MASSISIFNSNWYLQQNLDVAAAVNAGIFTAEEHFELYGKAEGRNPGPLFNVDDYLAANKDVAAAVEEGHITAYDHFLAFGAEEGRAPLASFDPVFYLAQNKDVAEAVDAGDITAVQHFLLYGQGEARSFSPAIDLGQYMEANKDVADAVAAGSISAFEHLMMFGAAEGRDLGNGIDLAIFKDDATFQDAIKAGNVEAALARVDAVAPFLPSFEAPEGWKPAADTPIPTDFTPPEGVKLVIPEGVEIPEGTELPDSFEPPVTPFEVSFTDLSAAAQKDGFLLAGTTNPATGFVVANNEEAGIELGLDVRYRGDSTDIQLDADTTNVFTVDPLNVSDLRFAYSVTSLDGKGDIVAIDLDKYDFKLSIDTDATEGTNFITFNLKEQDSVGEANDNNPSPYEWVENVTGDAVARVITDDGGNLHTTQNIQALQWYQDEGKALEAGEIYTVKLDAYVKGTDKLMASSDIIIAVGTPEAAPADLLV